MKGTSAVKVSGQTCELDVDGVFGPKELNELRSLGRKVLDGPRSENRVLVSQVLVDPS